MNQQQNFDKAKYLATLILQCSSLAELYVKDYEAELYKQGSQSRQAAKKMITDNAKMARSLRLSLSRLENILKDKLTDELIDSSNDMLDNMGILPDLNNPDAVKKYNKSLIGTIWPEHSAQHNADKMSADLKAKRDLRRRGVTQQDIEKPPVAAGTVRTGSGQVMQK